MSRANWINELVDLGYEPGVLDGLNNNELAELVQEEFIENTWSPEARAAAAKARHHASMHGIPRKLPMAKKMSGKLKEGTKKLLTRAGYRKRQAAGESERKEAASALRLKRLGLMK